MAVFVMKSHMNRFAFLGVRFSLRDQCDEIFVSISDVEIGFIPEMLDDIDRAFKEFISFFVFFEMFGTYSQGEPFSFPQVLGVSFQWEDFSAWKLNG